MAAAELLADVSVGIVAHLVDAITAKPQHGARALIRDARR
jgi:hypothetical protein